MILINRDFLMNRRAENRKYMVKLLIECLYLIHCPYTIRGERMGGIIFKYSLRIANLI